ncbi:MAG: 50S ribosomal protein L9 [Gammaproteobacteria bacterium]|nr:MAG: 50S ribosomal protein L9 [Gammaproteobacteria bacterium]
MEVILLERINNLGNLGDQVKVKNGFARNYLLPAGKATVANEANKAEFEARRAELETAQTDVLSSAQARAEKLVDVTVEIASRASDEGKLFGSIGAREIVQALAAAGHEVSRSAILLPEGPVKEIGEYEIAIALHPEVPATVKVNVVAES